MSAPSNSKPQPPPPPTVIDAFPLTVKELVDFRQGVPIIRKGK